MSAQPVSPALLSNVEVIYNGPARYIHPYFKKEMTADGIREFRAIVDGEENVVYTCAHEGCKEKDGQPYRRSSFASVRGHRSKHSKALRADRERDDKSPQEVGREVERIIMRTVEQQVKRIRRERDDWKARAQTAEKDLKQYKTLADALVHITQK